MKLVKLLLFYDLEAYPIDRIQVVTGDRDWDQADELLVNSDLLITFYLWEVTEMRSERSFIDGSPVIRVLIEEKTNPNTMAHRHKPVRNCVKPSRNAGFSSFFNFLPYKPEANCRKIIREMTLWSVGY